MQKLLLTAGFFLMTIVPCLAGANIEEFKEKDPYGISMAIIAMSVVFVALLILFLCFKWSGNLLNKHMGTHTDHNASKAAAKMTVTDKSSGLKVSASDEVYAAIGMALFIAEGGMHDEESSVLTLQPSESSAWSGRGNNHKQEPLRKF